MNSYKLNEFFGYGCNPAEFFMSMQVGETVTVEFLPVQAERFCNKVEKILGYVNRKTGRRSGYLFEMLSDDTSAKITRKK